MSHFVIIANGPWIAPGVILNTIQHPNIVALDGAANQLLALGIKPQVILGDFDSIDPKTQTHWGIRQTYATLEDHAAPYLGHDGVTIVPAKDQMLTDLVKGIRYCDQQQAEQITILCATGGREDHHEANKRALQTEYRPQRPILMVGAEQILRWAKHETVVLKGEIGDYCGFVATEGSYGDSRGLLYPCKQAPYSFSNQLSAVTATLAINGEALLIMPLKSR